MQNRGMFNIGRLSSLFESNQPVCIEIFHFGYIELPVVGALYCLGCRAFLSFSSSEMVQCRVCST